MLKILIGDEHPIVREGIKRILSHNFEIVTIDEADCTGEVMRKLAANDYDLVSIEIDLPGKSWLQTIEEIRTRNRNTPILVISAHPEDRYAVRALKSGASGYILKKSSPEELLSAIRHVASGRKYVSANLAEKLAETLNRNGDKLPHELLSDREYEVLCLIASGKTVSEIGRLLSLSTKTISTYRSRLLEKMGLENNATLTYYAIKHKLVSW